MVRLLAWPLYGLRWLAWRLGEIRRRWARAPTWISILVETSPSQLPPPPGPFWQRFLGQPSSLWQLDTQLRQVAGDSRVQGVLLQLRPVPLTAAQGQALAGMLAQVRAAGKSVACWASLYTADTYPVACAADQVFLAPGGEVAALGVSRTYIHLKDALARVGVAADLVQITPYKTAGDILTKSSLTREAREMADWLADGQFGDLLEAVAGGRGVDASQARKLVDASPYTDEQALAAGAVDALVTEEQLHQRLGRAPQPFTTARRRLRRRPPARPGPAVALLRVEGVIVDGRSRRAPLRPPLPLPLVFENQAGDLTLVAEARRLAQSRRVAAVVLWVESGGGSATASFAIASALRELGARKPLVAVMGTVAASGGYEVAAPARRIYAQPGTLTGSIGVLGGKVVAAGLLDHLLVNRSQVARGKHSTIASPERPYSRSERAWLRTAIERSYRLFLGDVASGRGRPVDEIEAVAGGRVWTGRQALERGLVDELAGLSAALEEARRLAGLRPDAPLRETRGRAGEMAPAGASAAVDHALGLVSALERASTWLLLPWLRR